MMERLRCDVGYVTAVFTKKVVSIRMLMALLFPFLIYDYDVQGILAMADRYQVKLTPLHLPFLMNDLEFQVVFGLCVLYLFSDAPFLQRWKMPYLNRIGKRRWIRLQCAELLLISVSYMLLQFLMEFCRILSRADFKNDWDAVLFTLANGGVSDLADITIYDEVINLNTPLMAFVKTFLLGTAVLFMIGLLVFAMSILWNRMVAAGIAVAICIMPILVTNMYSFGWKPMQYCYYYSPISWIGIGNRYNRSIYYPGTLRIILMLCGGMILAWILIQISMRKKDLMWDEEE